MGRSGTAQGPRSLVSSSSHASTKRVTTTQTPQIATQSKSNKLVLLNAPDHQEEEQDNSTCVMAIKLTSQLLKSLEVCRKDDAAPITLTFNSSTSGELHVWGEMYSLTATDERSNDPSAQSTYQMLARVRQSQLSKAGGAGGENGVVVARGDVIRKITVATSVTSGLTANALAAHIGQNRAKPASPKATATPTPTSPQTKAPSKSTPKRPLATTTTTSTSPQNPRTATTPPKTNPAWAHERSNEKTLQEKARALLSKGSLRSKYLASELGVQVASLHSILAPIAVESKTALTWSLLPQTTTNDDTTKAKKTSTNGSRSNTPQQNSSNPSTPSPPISPKAQQQQQQQQQQLSVEEQERMKTIQNLLQKNPLPDAASIPALPSFLRAKAIQSDTEYRDACDQFNRQYTTYTAIDEALSCCAADFQKLLDLCAKHKPVVADPVASSAREAIQKLYAERNERVRELVEMYHNYHRYLEATKREIQNYRDKQDHPAKKRRTLTPTATPMSLDDSAVHTDTDSDDSY